ncbi:MAG: hypothetical protein ACJAW3_000932 [Lentimonas sp.]|jgi:hypothetical protein
MKNKIKYLIYAVLLATTVWFGFIYIGVKDFSTTIYCRETLCSDQSTDYKLCFQECLDKNLILSE